MRKLNDFEIQNIRVLEDNGIDFTAIKPTKTGLDKSIMDSTGIVRDYLAKYSIHNYENQQKGRLYKMFIKSYLLTTEGHIDSVATLYRPETKKGDPRIWFTNLRKYANPNDILVIMTYSKELYLLNITKLNVNDLLIEPNQNSFKRLLNLINQE